MSASKLARLRSVRAKIASKEAEIGELVAQAQKRSDRRVRREEKRLEAGDELEAAVLDLQALREGRVTAMEEAREKQLLLERELDLKRLDVLATAPPFIVKLEKALAVVACVEERAECSPGHEAGLVSTETRWRSSVVSLMKDASDAMERRLELSDGNEVHATDSNNKDRDLRLASALARRLAIHINAWPPRSLNEELSKLWLLAATAESRTNKRFRLVLNGWQSVEEQLALRSLKAKNDDTRSAEAIESATERVRDCKARAKIVQKVEKTGWWDQRGEELLQKDLRYLASKVAPLCSSAELAARYNLLLAKCAGLGSWETAIATYQSMDSRYRNSRYDGVDRRKGVASSPSPVPLVYHHLLRAAKNAVPSRPVAAFSVLLLMRSRGDIPVASHYHIVLSACARTAARAVGAITTSAMNVAHTGVSSSSSALDSACASSATSHDGDALRVTVAENSANDLGGLESSERVVGVDVTVSESRSSSNAGRSSQCSTDPSPINADAKSIASASVPPLADSLRRTPNDGSSSLANNVARNDLSGGTGTRKRFDITQSLREADSEPETASEALKLALDVIADMWGHGVRPTEVTYKSLVEVCRCTAMCRLEPSGRGQCELSKRESLASGACSPADVYATLKHAGVPDEFCYAAGIENALRGGRQYPAYVSEIYR